MLPSPWFAGSSMLEDGKYEERFMNENMSAKENKQKDCVNCQLEDGRVCLFSSHTGTVCSEHWKINGLFML